MHRPLVRSVRSFVVIGLAAAALAGCKQKIDPVKAEALCKSVLKEADLTVKSVECPKDIEAKKGNDFECTATTDEGDTLKMSVAQQDDNGTVLAKVKKGTIDLATVGASIVKKAGGKAEVKCKHRFVVPKVDKTYKCDLESDGDKKDLSITFTDDEGAYKWKVSE
jgi:type IV pilus biogenesis protein CpaD/CtpE